MLERLGIAALERVRCGALSGGERRRAHLAVALLRRPACLLLDEPFRGIDPLDAETVQAELRGLAGAGCAVVITGHEATWTLGVAGRVTWLRNGTTQSFATRAEAEADWHFRRGYLGTP